MLDIDSRIFFAGGAPLRFLSVFGNFLGWKPIIVLNLNGWSWYRRLRILTPILGFFVVRVLLLDLVSEWLRLIGPLAWCSLNMVKFIHQPINIWLLRFPSHTITRLDRWLSCFIKFFLKFVKSLVDIGNILFLVFLHAVHLRQDLIEVLFKVNVLRNYHLWRHRILTLYISSFAAKITLQMAICRSIHIKVTHFGSWCSSTKS